MYNTVYITLLLNFFRLLYIWVCLYKYVNVCIEYKTMYHLYETNKTDIPMVNIQYSSFMMSRIILFKDQNYILNTLYARSHYTGHLYIYDNYFLEQDDLYCQISHHFLLVQMNFSILLF